MNDIENPKPANPKPGDGGNRREGGNRRRRFRGRRRRPPGSTEPSPAVEAIADEPGTTVPAEAVPAGESSPPVRRERDSSRNDRRGESGSAGGREARPGNAGGEGSRGGRPGNREGQRPDRGPRGNTRPGGSHRTAGGDRPGAGRSGGRPVARPVARPDRPAYGPRPVERVQPVRGEVAPQPPVLRVLLAGGGTGGHIYPALSIADEIMRRNRESRVMFVGTRSGLEAKLIPDAGYTMTHIDVSGFAGRGPLARIRALFQLGAATLKMRGIIREFQPELVVGTGGYVSGPAVLAARWGKIRTIIQEQNSIPGQMNRFLARYVDEIHVAFTETRRQFAQTEKIRLSGNPTRIRQPGGSLTDLYRRWGLDASRKTVLVVGGSRGARSLNQAAAAMLSLFSGRRDIQFIIQTGEADQEIVRKALSAVDVLAVVRPYLSPIEEAYALATMVVCRAGAMTLAEISQFGLPAILVPYPHAIYQHQLMNAKILAGKDAAELLLDQDLTGPVLFERIRDLLGDQSRRRLLGRNVWNLARPDARERLVNSIEQLTHPVAVKSPTDWVSADVDVESAPALEEA